MLKKPLLHLWMMAMLLSLLITSAEAQDIFGATIDGGSGHSGTIVKHNVQRHDVSTIFEFPNTNSSGANPQTRMLLINNKFYGVTLNGGSTNSGVLYEFDPVTNTNVVKADLGLYGISKPIGGLVQVGNKLYGMTQRGGSLDKGAIYSWDLTTGALTVHKQFDGPGGESPNGRMCLASDGMLYGLTPKGGASNTGVLFKFSPTNNDYAFVSFASDIVSPNETLMQASDGFLYGLTTGGNGSIFKYDLSSGAISIVKTFDNKNYQSPGALVEIGGKLYGIKQHVFEYNLSTAAYTTIAISVVLPRGSLTKINGKLYFPATYFFNPGYYLKYYQLDPVSKAATQLGDILTNGWEDNYTYGVLVRYTNVDISESLFNGKIYTCQSRAGFASGSILKLNATSPFQSQVLYNFEDAATGSYATGSLVRKGDKLYGLLLKGGATGNGTLYSIGLNGDGFQVLYNLPDQGVQLIKAKTGILYWCSYTKIYSYDPATSLISVVATISTNVGTSFNSLTETSTGRLVGTTSGGGANGVGTIFEINAASGALTVLTSFRPKLNGNSPDGYPKGAVAELNGKLYALRGGPYSGGGVATFGITEVDIQTGASMTYGQTSAYFEDPQYDAGVLTSADGNLYYATYNATTGIITQDVWDADAQKTVKKYVSGSIYKFDPITKTYTLKIGQKFVGHGINFHGTPAQALSGYMYLPVKGASIYCYKPGVGSDRLPGAGFDFAPSITPLITNDIQDLRLPTLNLSYCTPAFDLIATSNSSQPITYESSDQSIVRITNGNHVDVLGVGSVTIYARQAGDDRLAPAEVAQTVVVQNCTPIIDFTLPAKTCGDSPFFLSASSSSPAQIMFTSLDASIADVSVDNNVTMKKPGAVTIRASQAATGNYSAVTKDVTLLIAAVNPPAPSANGTTTFCEGGNVTLSSPPADSYLWSNGTLTRDLIATTTGSYYVAVTKNGCTETTPSVAVTVKPKPADLTVNGPGGQSLSQVICSGQNSALMLSSSAGATFSWITQSIYASGASDGSGSSISQVLSASSNQPGSVVYTVTSVLDGCEKQSPVTVTVNPIPSITNDIASSIVCSGTTFSFTPSFNVSGSSFSWTSAPGAGVTILPAGNQQPGELRQITTNSTTNPATLGFTITPTFAGCAGPSKNLNLTVRPGTGVTISGSTVACSGGTKLVASVPTSFGTVTWLWSNAKTTSYIFVSTAGSYTVTATDAYSCVVTSPVHQMTNGGSAYISASGTLCSGMTLTASYGTQYRWSTGSTSRSITVRNEGTYWCNVTLTTGCVYTAYYTVGDIPESALLSSQSKESYTTQTYPCGTSSASVYPSPANSNVRVRLPAGTEVEVPVKVFDLLGNHILSSTIHRGQLNTVIDVSSLPNGIYVIQLERRGIGVEATRVVVNHESSNSID